jgi:hypothetical protein
MLAFSWEHDVVPQEPHLQMIQSVISRLSSQSTAVKTWCVTVTAALLGLGATATTPIVALIAVYVVAAFAALDAYYLSLERAYRRLYREAVDDVVHEWSLSIKRPQLDDVLSAMRSPAVSVLYGSSLFATLGIGIYVLTRR